MSPRVWQERVRDILQAIQEIRAFTEGMDFETFQNDDKTIRAVEMNLIIIGEAAGQIPEDIQEKTRKFPGR
jgi:uncharacterized protein with HEPN domain